MEDTLKEILDKLNRIELGMQDFRKSIISKEDLANLETKMMASFKELSSSLESKYAENVKNDHELMKEVTLVMLNMNERFDRVDQHLRLIDFDFDIITKRISNTERKINKFFDLP